MTKWHFDFQHSPLSTFPDVSLCKDDSGLLILLHACDSKCMSLVIYLANLISSICNVLRLEWALLTSALMKSSVDSFMAQRAFVFKLKTWAYFWIDTTSLRTSRTSLLNGLDGMMLWVLLLNFAISRFTTVPLRHLRLLFATLVGVVTIASMISHRCKASHVNIYDIGVWTQLPVSWALF